MSHQRNQSINLSGLSLCYVWLIYVRPVKYTASILHCMGTKQQVTDLLLKQLISSFYFIIFCALPYSIYTPNTFLSHTKLSHCSILTHHYYYCLSFYFTAFSILKWQLFHINTILSLLITHTHHSCVFLLLHNTFILFIKILLTVLIIKAPKLLPSLKMNLLLSPKISVLSPPWYWTSSKPATSRLLRKLTLWRRREEPEIMDLPQLTLNLM